jgi:hypothetical protein
MPNLNKIFCGWVARSLLILMVIGGVCRLQQANAAPKPTSLFSQGAETFKIQDQSGKTPQYRVLDDTGTEQALALGIISTLNSQKDFQPKLPMKEHIDLRVETLSLKPVAGNANELAIALKLSGYNLELENKVDRARFLSGQPIEINFPATERDVTLFTVHSSGRLKMRLNPKTDVVLLDDVQAKMNFTSPLGGEGSEAIRFSGRGIRQK